MNKERIYENKPPKKKDIFFLKRIEKGVPLYHTILQLILVPVLIMGLSSSVFSFYQLWFFRSLAILLCSVLIVSAAGLENKLDRYSDVSGYLFILLLQVVLFAIE